MIVWYAQAYSRAHNHIVAHWATDHVPSVHTLIATNLVITSHWSRATDHEPLITSQWPRATDHEPLITTTDHDHWSRPLITCPVWIHSLQGWYKWAHTIYTHKHTCMHTSQVTEPLVTCLWANTQCSWADRNRFETMKDEFTRSLQNSKKSPPYSRAMDSLSRLMKKKSYSVCVHVYMCVCVFVRARVCVEREYALSVLK